MLFPRRKHNSCHIPPLLTQATYTRQVSPAIPNPEKKKVLHDVPGAFNYLGEGEEETDANDGDVILLPVVGGTMAGGMLPGQRTDEDLAGNNIRGERETGGG